ncbi:MAG TPA: FeoA family protein [Flavobacteriales bacterium]|nr:FeoA family protein [Flavobacteriales bacterium]
MTATSTNTLSLDLLPEQHWATVADVTIPTTTADRDLVLRLVELGFVPGERVRIVAEGINGRDPIAVRVGHTTFALRRHEASFILVEPHA